MTSLLLLGWAAAVAVLAGPVLTTPRMTSVPRLTIGLWFGAQLSVAGAVLAAGLLVAVPPDALATGLAGIVAACAQALRNLDAPSGPYALAGLAATALLAARLATSMTTTLAAGRRWRRRHLAALLPVGCDHERGKWILVEHPAPVVYCLPGRPGRVVVTRGAVEALSADEFAAVLRHERAHLRGRHHLLVALAGAFHRAVPGLPMASAAEREIRKLVEHLADDRASDRHGRHAVASAIVRLADRTPVHALGAAAVPIDRVRRMLAPPVRPGVVHRLLAVAAIGLLPVLPPALVIGSTELTVPAARCSTDSPPADAGAATRPPAG